MAQIDNLFGVCVLEKDGAAEPENAANGLGIWFYEHKDVAKLEAGVNRVDDGLFKANIAFSNPFECDLVTFQKEHLDGNHAWREKLLDDGYDAVIVKNSEARYYVPLGAGQITVVDANP